MLRRFLLASAVALVVPLAVADTASAAVTMTFPRPVTYVDNVPVGWTATEPLSRLQMVWTYRSGPYAGVVTQPVTLTLRSTATSGSFPFNPSLINPTTIGANANFAATTGTLPDGAWAVYMKETRASDGLVFQSSTVTLSTSTATAPPSLTTPAANATTNTVPVSFTLPDPPSLSAPIVLTFTNQSSNAVSTLSLVNSRNQSFSLDPTSLAGSASVVSVTGPGALADGTYNVTLSYQDSSGHPVASTTDANWTLDRTTAAPSLAVPTAPTAGSPLALQFTLPEAPLAGSATLTFTGPTTVTLALSATTAGAGSLSLDPLALGAASGVSSVSPVGATLPDGTYAVVLSYQDALGNPAGTVQQTAIIGPAAIASPAAPASPVAVIAPVATATATATVPVSPPTPTPVGPALAPEPSNRFTLIGARARGVHGAIALTLSLPGQGSVAVLGTHSRPEVRSLTHGTLLRPGWKRLAYGRDATDVAAAGTIRLTLRPGTSGRRLLGRERRADRPLHIRVWVTYTPTGGVPRSAEMTVPVLTARR